METTYHPNWQKNRVSFILSKYGNTFFEGKRVLELGSFNGYIGSRFGELGADVTSVEGRADNYYSIKTNCPNIRRVILADLDIADWAFGPYDIIINFGVFYHLKDHHLQHLTNCLNNCRLLFFETVIYDSFAKEICLIDEDSSGIDQGLSKVAGVPSTKYVESIFEDNGRAFLKVCSAELNGDGHTYDWYDSNSKRSPLRSGCRRLWLVRSKDSGSFVNGD